MAVQDSAPRSKGEWLADKDLVGRVNAGDGLAFRQVMERYNQCLYRVARAIMSDDAEAEDVVQESYVRAFAAMKDFRGDSGLRTWLTRIVINEGRGRLRRRRTRHDNGFVGQPGDGGALIVGFPGGQPVESPDSQAARAEVRRLLETAIEALPDVFRLVYILREIQEYSVEETAALLAIAPETVKTRLHRARRLLRQSLDATLSEAIRGSFPFLGKRCERLTETVMRRLAAAP